MPTFANQQIQVEALGLALNGDEAYYLSAVGPKAALKGLWASLIANNARQPYAPGWQYQSFKAASGGVQQLWAPLPRSNAQHLILRGQAPGLILVTDAAAASLAERDTTTTSARQARLAARLPEQAYPQLSAYLEQLEFVYQNEPARLPVLTAWAPSLWAYATAPAATFGRGLTGISAYGDCLGAWLVNARYPWLDVISLLIKTGQLTW